jgi:hypothetical protein
VWKTGPALAGRCGRLELGLVDGSDHHAVFRFTRRHGERAVRTA